MDLFRRLAPLLLLILDMMNIIHLKKKTNPTALTSLLWLFIGTFLILLPIFTYLTLDNIHRRREISTRILLEKGAALIRSFEAGTRLGIRGRFGTGFKLQKLLEETAQQPDIKYLMVTNDKGRILAHGNPEIIGRSHGRDLDLIAVVESDALHWRLVSTGYDPSIFEVYGKFEPTAPASNNVHERRMPMHSMFNPRMMDPDAPKPELIIFMGLDTSAVEAARIADTRQMIVMGAALLLLAFSGIAVLLLLGRYRLAKQSLSRVKAFSDNLVEHMPVGLVALDHDQNIAAMNHVAGGLLGFSPEESIGKPGIAVLPQALMAALDHVVPLKGVFEQEMDCLVNNETLHLEIAATLLEDQDLNFMGHIILFKDKREIYALRKEIARNQRLVTVGRLAAGIAHEIRNPLSSIKGFATYFKQRYQDNAEDRKTADIMIQEVERLNTVVSQLLEFAKPLSVEKKKTSLNALLADSLKLVEQQAKTSHVDLIFQPADPDPKVSLDPNRITQALLNLILNAMESMKTGGRLTITTSHAGPENGIRIHVADTGCGISPENLNHIFDLYYTTKPTGTGLGLAIVHNIMEAHGGKIEVESMEGKGSTFSLFLPFHGND